jgi:hypothetical protein
MTNEKLTEVGRLKSLVSYFDEVNHIWYLERQETKGVLFPIYKGEFHHIARVHERISQSKKVWKKIKLPKVEMTEVEKEVSKVKKAKK